MSGGTYSPESPPSVRARALARRRGGFYHALMTAPLQGIRIVGRADIAPTAFAGRMSAGRGPALLRVEREHKPPRIPPGSGMLGRSRTSIARLDLQKD